MHSWRGMERGLGTNPGSRHLLLAPAMGERDPLDAPRLRAPPLELILRILRAPPRAHSADPYTLNPTPYTRVSTRAHFADYAGTLLGDGARGRGCRAGLRSTSHVTCARAR